MYSCTTQTVTWCTCGGSYIHLCISSYVVSCIQLHTGVPTKAQERRGEGRQLSLYCRLVSYLPHACTHAGTLLPVVIGQNCELVFSIRKLRKQKNAVHVSGLIVSELPKSGRVTSNQLTCTCKRGKRDRLAHWVGPNGPVTNDPTSHVFYKLASRRRGTAVKLWIKQRQSFACSDAGEYTCVIGKSNRTAVLRPISELVGHSIAIITRLCLYSVGWCTLLY